ncbi:MAG: DNA cytosine methyltransferase [Planctomycetes bacterium]|nr:DNA cytosine methyltransferase [Planctomycetota bacterium]
MFGEIPTSFVDSRSIKDVDADYVRGFRQCHFFAGIGGWPLAFALAGIPDWLNTWSGSCPCQPYSTAGKGKAQADPRHLWPVWFPLIRECRPQYVFGEQVSAAIGHGWLDGVFADMEAAGYTGGACVLGAHSKRAPHIRQRVWWGFKRNGGVSNLSGSRLARAGQGAATDGHGADSVPQRGFALGESAGSGGLQHATGQGLERRDIIRGVYSGATCSPQGQEPFISGDDLSWPRNSNGGGQWGEGSSIKQVRPDSSDAWSDYTIAEFRDGKRRRVGRGVQCLADGIPFRSKDPRMGYLLTRLRGMGHDSKAARRILDAARSNRTGRLKCYGNAIIPQVAAVFIQVFMEVMG